MLQAGRGESCTHCSMISSGSLSKAELLVAIFSIEGLLTASEDMARAPIVMLSCRVVVEDVDELRSLHLSFPVHGCCASAAIENKRLRVRAPGFSQKLENNNGRSGSGTQEDAGSLGHQACYVVCLTWRVEGVE